VSDSISPVYSDVFAKMSWTINDRNRVAVHLLTADDGLHYTNNSGVIRSEYGSHYAWLTWDAQLGERLSGQSVWSASGLTWSRAGTPSFKLSEDMHDHRTFTDWTMREDWSLALSGQTAIKFGGEAHALGASYDYSGIHTTTSVVNGTATQTSSAITADLTPDGNSLGAYVAPRVAIGSWLTAEAGARIDRTSYTTDALVSPRANIVANVTPSTSLRASVGRYDQPQPIYSLQVGDGVNTFAPADISNQRALGVEQHIGGGMSVRAEAYDREIVRERPRYVNLRLTTDVFPEFPFDRVLLLATSGRSHGVEMMARRQAIDGFEWTASYAIASVTDDVDGVSIPRMYDQRHTVYVDGSYHPAGSTWRFSAAWQIHSGWPQPPITFRVDTLRAGSTPNVIVTPVVGPLSSIGAQRLPWYRRLDLRYTRDVVTSHGRLSFFADVYNVFNAKNPRYDDYSVDVQNGRLVTRPVPNSQVGRLPSAGIAWDF
jgi:hypothetical protein